MKALASIERNEIGVAEQPYWFRMRLQALRQEPGCQTLATLCRRHEQAGEPLPFGNRAQAQGGDDIVALPGHPQLVAGLAAHGAAMLAVELVHQWAQCDVQLAVVRHAGMHRHDTQGCASCL